MSNRVGLAYQAKKREAAIKETENAIIGKNWRDHVALTRSAPDEKGDLGSENDGEERHHVSSLVSCQ